MESINLDEYIRARVYGKNETFNQTEVINAINNLTLVNIVPTLPTSNIRNNQLYLVLNDENLDEEYHNRYDLYVYVDNQWEQIDSLEFNINDYYTKGETDNKLSLKAEVNHGHNNATTLLDGFLSYTDKLKLDGIEENANKTTIDSSLSSSSTNPVQNKVVNTALNGKAPKDHSNTATTYGVSTNTKYGHAKASNTLPLMDNGNGSIGTDNGVYALADHVHPTDTTRASNTSATTLSAGLMSASDKQKLDNIIIDNTLTNNNHLTVNSGLKNYIDTAVRNATASETGGITIDDTVTSTSDNPVSSSGIKSYVDNAVSNMSDSDFLTKLNTAITNMNNIT